MENKKRINYYQSKRCFTYYSDLKALKYNSELQELSEKTLISLIKTEPNLILTLKNPSKEVIKASIELSNDVIRDIPEHLIDNEVLEHALNTDFYHNLNSRENKYELSWSLKIVLQNKMKNNFELSKKAQEVLIQLHDLGDIINLVTEKELLIKYISKKPEDIFLINKIDYEIALMAVKKNYRTLSGVLESNFLTPKEKIRISLFCLNKQPKSLDLITMIDTKNTKDAKSLLQSKLEILESME